MRKYMLLFAVLLLSLAGGRAWAEVLISEIGPANRCTYFDEKGDTPDWVELYNSGEKAQALDGWALSDSKSGKKALALDGLTIEPEGYLLIPIGDTAGFHLSASGETVYLFRKGKLRQHVAYPALEDDVSYALLEEEYRSTWLPTPGSTNIFLEDGAQFIPEEGPRFNEVLTSAAPYRNTEGYDYLEIKNTGRLQSLKGWQIRLGTAGMKTYTIPDKSLGKGDLYALYCADDNVKTPVSGFALPAQGALISLWRKDGTLADFIRLPLQYANIPYGRSRDSIQWGYLAAQSYGRQNAETVYPTRLEAPVLSLAGGVYSGDTVTVKITGPEGAEIRYTTDGDLPGAKSALYTEPLVLKETTALRACAFAEGALTSADASATYVLGLEADFPVVCLIIDNYYLTDRNAGLITGSTDGTHNYRFHWEYPANFEFFDAEGLSRINQACGFAIQGDSSRGERQKGFKLIARKSYGTDDTFDFNPFENRSFTGYKSFNLRAAGSEGPVNPRFRDAALSSLAEGTSLLYSAVQPVLVYMNGKIYGHYNLRERINKYFIAQHCGITDPEEIDRIDILSETGDWVRNGSNADYKALSRYMKNNDLNDPDKLDYVLSRMDVQSYFEYVAFMMATGNRDLSNSRFYRVPGGQWKWLLWDLDRAMEDAEHYAAFWLFTLDIDHELELMTDHVPFAALMKVPAMRERFLATLGDVLYTRFTPARVISLIDEWHDKLAGIMPYQLKRWAKSETMHYWESLVEKLRVFARERPAMTVKYAQRFFNMTDEETQLYLGDYLSALEKE